MFYEFIVFMNYEMFYEYKFEYQSQFLGSGAIVKSKINY